jgi:hypothetical protein
MLRIFVLSIILFYPTSIFAQDFLRQPLNFSGGVDRPFGGQTIIETDTGYMLIQPQAGDLNISFKKDYIEAKQARDKACSSSYYNDLSQSEIKFPSTTHQLKIHENHPFRIDLELKPQPRQFKTSPSVIVSFDNYSAYRPARPKVKTNTLKAINYPLIEGIPALNGVLVPIKIPNDLSHGLLENIPLASLRVINALHKEAEWCRNTPPEKETVDLEIKVRVSSVNFYSAMKNLVQAHTFSGLICQTPYAFTFQELHHKLEPDASLEINFDTSIFKQVCTTKSKRICESVWLAGVRVTKCFDVSLPHIYVEEMSSIELTANIAIDDDISYKISGNGRYLPTSGGSIDLEYWRTILSEFGIPYSGSRITDSDDGPSFTLLYRVNSLPKHDAQILASVIKAEMKRSSLGEQ